MQKSNDLIVVTIFVLLLTVEIIHTILNFIYQPFTGLMDNMIHILLFFSGFFYILSFAYFALRISDRYSQPTSKFFKIALPAILILVLIAQAIYAYNFGHTDNIKKMGSNGGYYMLFPTYFGGVLQGALTAVVAKSTFKNRKLLFLLFLISLVWVTIPLSCDGLLYTEGGARGMGPLAQLPFIADLIWGQAFILLFFIILAIYSFVFGLLNILSQFLHGKSDLNLMVCFNLRGLALVLSVLSFCLLSMGWLDFITD